MKRSSCFIGGASLVTLALLLGPSTALNLLETLTQKAAPPTNKRVFLESLDTLESVNTASSERTAQVKELIAENPTPQPGSTASFAPLAAGTWTVVYAPHIAFVAPLVQFGPVLYDLKPDGTMISHARYEFGSQQRGWLSVSGTYSSQNENTTCRVDFDHAWVRIINNNENNGEAVEDRPFATLDQVPSSWHKDWIDRIGRLFFIDAVSVFPVSYLDSDLIVFDFELLGTRICARKSKR